MIKVVIFIAVTLSILFWSVSNMKEEQPKSWIVEPSNELMDYES